MIPIPYYLKFILVALLVWLFYSGIFLPEYFHFRTESNGFHYFKDLAYSFLHGHTDVRCPAYPDCHDLSEFHGKNYLYWPPVPAIIYMPWVAIFGLNTPDDLIVSIIGFLNVLFFMLVLKQMAKWFQLNISDNLIAWFGIFWGLGTVHFYMSMNSSVWFFAQVVAQLVLLTSIYMLLIAKGKTGILLSGLLFAGAVFSRNHLIFSIPFFVCIYAYKFGKIKWFQHSISFGIPILLAFILNGWYNYARFGDVMNNGLYYQNIHPYFKENFENFGFFSFHYIPENFFIEVLKFPKFQAAFPLLLMDYDGFGLLWNSPVFLFLIPAVILIFFQWKTKLMLNWLFVTSLISSVCIALLVFSIMGPGWVQFASRYSLDYQFFLIIPIVILFHWYPNKKWMKYASVIPLLWSIFSNFAGVYLFYGIGI